MAEASLRRFRPSARDPWDYVKAAHLLHRAGLGGPPEEIERLVALGMDGAVAALLNYEPVPDDGGTVDFTNLRQLFADAVALRQANADENARRALQNRINRTQLEKLQEVREWWMRRLITTRRPLQEKMVLFWHGLLVSGFPEVRNPEFLFMQNAHFRRQALGNFKQLILDISRDPAMLTYLDNNSNRKGRPNENYARELLELFTMGIGNYTEQDIKEAARAFTGWTHRYADFYFDRNQHDGGPKTFLGRTGNFDGGDIINIIFEQPATARWLPRKLFEFFVSLRPPEPLVNELGAVFRRGNWEVRPLLRTLLESEAFYAPAALRGQVKSPVHLVVSSARALAAPLSAARAILAAADQMGQALLAPPNVGGWPTGESWITTATILDRYNFGGLMTGGRMPGLRRPALEGFAPADAIGLVPVAAGTAGEVIDGLLRRLLPGAALEQRRLFALWRAVGGNRASDPVQVTPQRVRNAVHLIMSMPEFQLT